MCRPMWPPRIRSLADAVFTVEMAAAEMVKAAKRTARAVLNLFDMLRSIGFEIGCPDTNGSPAGRNRFKVRKIFTGGREKLSIFKALGGRQPKGQIPSPPAHKSAA